MEVKLTNMPSAEDVDALLIARERLLPDSYMRPVYERFRRRIEGKTVNVRALYMAWMLSAESYIREQYDGDNMQAAIRIAVSQDFDEIIDLILDIPEMRSAAKSVRTLT